MKKILISLLALSSVAFAAMAPEMDQSSYIIHSVVPLTIPGQADDYSQHDIKVDLGTNNPTVKDLYTAVAVSLEKPLDEIRLIYNREQIFYNHDPDGADSAENNRLLSDLGVPTGIHNPVTTLAYVPRMSFKKSRELYGEPTDTQPRCIIM